MADAILYKVSQVYKVISRVTVHEVVTHLKAYDNLFVLLEDGDDPTPVKNCISYLESLAPSRKVSIMSYEGEQTRWN